MALTLEKKCPLCDEPVTRYDAASYDADPPEGTGQICHNVCIRKSGRQVLREELRRLEKREQGGS